MKKLTALVTSTLLALLPVVPVQPATVSAAGRPLVSSPVNDITCEPQSTWIANPTPSPQTTTTSDALYRVPKTTDATPPSDISQPNADTEFFGAFYSEIYNSRSIRLGEELDISDYSVRITIKWGEGDNTTYADPTIYTNLEYGQEAGYFTVDTSAVDTSVPGTYIMYVIPKKDAEGVFTVPAYDSGGKLAPGSYNVKLLGETYDRDDPYTARIPVTVYDPAVTTTYAPPPYMGTTVAVGTEIAAPAQTTPVDTSKMEVGKIYATLHCSTYGVHCDLGSTPYLGREMMSFYLCWIDEDGTYHITHPQRSGFYINSEAHANCYTVDLSEVDSSTPGDYTIYIRPVAGATSTVEVSNNAELENGTYEFTMLDDTPLTIPVTYIDFSNPPETTTATDFLPIPTTPTTTAALVNTRTIWGDSNCDGFVTIADAALILQHIGNPDKYPLSAAALRNADCCDPGKGVSTLDALAVQFVDAGIIKSDFLPISSDFIINNKIDN